MQQLYGTTIGVDKRGEILSLRLCTISKPDLANSSILEKLKVTRTLKGYLQRMCREEHRITSHIQQSHKLHRSRDSLMFDIQNISIFQLVVGRNDRPERRKKSGKLINLMSHIRLNP